MKLLPFHFKPEKIIFSLLFFMAACLFILRGMLASSYLPETGGVSINVMYGIERILNDQPLYTNPEEPPFPIIQYMPLYFNLIKNICIVTGNRHDVHGMMVISRWFCLLMDVLSVIVIARTLINTLRVSSIISWTLSFIYFVSIPGIIYGRVDNLYLLLFITTVSILLKSLYSTDKSRFSERYAVELSGATTALALLTKQTAIFLAIFCFIYLLFIGKNYKSLLRYCLSCGIVFLAFFLLMLPDSLMHFKLNVIDGVKNGLNINWFSEVILKNFFLKFSYLIATGLLVSYYLLKENKHVAFLFVGIGIVWFFLEATLSSFKAGSGPNYYLEFIFMMIVGIGILIRHAAIHPEKYFLFALAISPFFLIASANDKGWGDTGLMKKSRTDYFNTREVVAYVLPKVKADEWVLTNFHKESTINLQLSDKALFPCREVALYFTRPLGVFHFNKFNELLNQHKISFIIDRKNKFPETFLDVELKNYVADTTIGNYTIYKLADRSVTSGFAN